MTTTTILAPQPHKNFLGWTTQVTANGDSSLEVFDQLPRWSADLKIDTRGLESHFVVGLHIFFL
jgi:hypothetical protein